MLTAKNLSFRYTENAPFLFEDVSLTVEPGEVVGLYGPSGQGKTTFAKILAGYLSPHAGTVTCDGEPLPQAAYCPVQLIFQHPELAMNPRWRVRRILAEGDEVSAEMLDSLSIEQGWIDRWPHELSGGELQRVAVARALGANTRYLIADEMTAMLDANTQAQIWRMVLKVAQERGLGLLVISHDAPLLKHIATRTVTISGE